MNRPRMLLWFALLALVLLIRIWDPLGGESQTVHAISEPVQRVGTQTVQPSAALPEHHANAPSWPVRALQSDDTSGNAFASRTELATLAAMRATPKAPPTPPPVTYTPPAPPPPPPEPQPPLQVIGTWGVADAMAVFLTGPQGTILARKGDVVLSQYTVQSITLQHITLLQNSNQRTWQIAIPIAPASFQTWPPR